MTNLFITFLVWGDLAVIGEEQSVGIHFILLSSLFLCQLSIWRYPLLLTDRFLSNNVLY